MINLTTTIQEITLQAYSFGVYSYLFEREHNPMSRDEILNLFENWGKEFEACHGEGFDWEMNPYYDEIDDFVLCKFNSIKVLDKVKAAFPFGIEVGDHITYNGGIYTITGFNESGVLVKEIGGVLDSEWETVEIGYPQSDKVDFLPDYEDIMDTTNGHNPELVKKINIAWNTKRMRFSTILCALYKRDIKEIMDSDAFAFPWKYGYTADDAYLYLAENWDIQAHNYLQHIADDTDLECILNFLHIQ